MNKKTQAVKPLFLYAPIERVNEERREVTAYAFVNEVVDGEGGIRLKRSAMEAATPDYMAWANVRRMHQPDAVGVAEAVVWDEKGALMTLRVVDDNAWEKVKQGVYKGLSVGVRPTVMRGKDVEKAVWFETSLVDRPKDPDSKFLALRADGFEDGEEFECEIQESGGRDQGPDVPTSPLRTLRGEGPLLEGEESLKVLPLEQGEVDRGAISRERDGGVMSGVLANDLSTTSWSTSPPLRAREDLLQQSAVGSEQLADSFPHPLNPPLQTSLDEGDFRLHSLADPQPPTLNPITLNPQQTISRLQIEVSEKAKELSRVLARAERAEERVKELEAQPAPGTHLVAKTGLIALDKEQIARFFQPSTQSKQDVETEIRRLSASPLDTDDPQGEKRAVAIGLLKAQAASIP